MFFDINCSQRVNQYLNIKLNVPKEKMIILDQACSDPTYVNQRKQFVLNNYVSLPFNLNKDYKGHMTMSKHKNVKSKKSEKSMDKFVMLSIIIN
jgi:hypothetical protein